MAKPKTTEDWNSLFFEISQLFDEAPIDEEELFAGRQTEIRRMLDATLSKSKHVVLFGERGVGKTSLSNIFWKRFGNTLQSFVVGRVQANPSLTFENLWSNALSEIQNAALQSGRSELLPIQPNFIEEINPTTIRREFSKANPNSIPVIIIDEYDKIVDEDARELTANLIKEFYDYGTNVTVILVGVAENIGTLVEDHQSIGRAIIQVPLNRMSDEELKEIILKRTNRTPMSFTGDAMWTIIALSQGLPFFTQTLSKHAALNAVESRRITIDTDDVESAMDKFIEDSEVSFIDAYRDATRSNQANYFKESLLACALAKTDDEGFFTANDVLEPYTAIMKAKKQIAHYEKHLRRFSSEDGGNILSKRGGDRQLQFRFSDPMMQPYVIIRGIQSKMIDDSARASLLQREQSSLPI